MALLFNMDDVNVWLRLLGLSGAAVISIGIIWQKVVTPLYRHGKRVTTGWIAASELIQAQLTPDSGGTLIDKVDVLVSKVGALVQANETEIAGLARVVADVAQLKHEQTLVADRLTVEQGKVSDLLKSAAEGVSAQLQENIGIVRAEQAEIAKSLKAETEKVAAVLASSNSLTSDAVLVLQKGVLSLQREHTLTLKRLTKVEHLLITIMETDK